MGFITGIIRTVIQWGLFLGMIGILGDATQFMFKNAAQAHSEGLVSLSKLNRSLTERRAPSKHVQKVTK